MIRHGVPVYLLLTAAVLSWGHCNAQANPGGTLDVWGSDWWDGYASADEFPGGDTRGSRVLILNVDVPAGQAVPGISTTMASPQGLNSLSSTQGGLVLDVDATANMLRIRPVAPLADEVQMVSRTADGHSTRFIPLSCSRSVSEPVLTEDEQIVEARFSFTVNASMSPYGSIHVFQAGDWRTTPPGVEIEVLSTIMPVAWSQEKSGLFRYDGVGVPEVGSTHEFVSQLRVTRSGPSSQASMGDMYFRPGASVQYREDRQPELVPGPQLTIPVSPGYEASASAPSGYDFRRSVDSEVSNIMFPGVATGFGPPEVTDVFIDRARRQTLTGELEHQFNLDLNTKNTRSARLTTPTGISHDMRIDEEGLDFSVRSASEAALTDFGPGVYTVALTGTDGSVRSMTVVLPDEAFPDEYPRWDQPPGWQTSDSRPLLSWATPTDSAVNLVDVEVDWLVEDEGSMMNPSQTQYAVAADIPEGGVITELMFGRLSSALTGGDIVVNSHALWSHHTQSYFNVVPEPATMSLLGLGGLAILHRRRAL